MNTLEETPGYWKRLQLELLTMIKQLGLPTFFITLPSVDVWCHELIEIIRSEESDVLTEDDIYNMNYFDRTRIPNSNHVFFARHFQYMAEVIFKKIVSDGALSKVKYRAIRVELQVRGSAHIHS